MAYDDPRSAFNGASRFVLLNVTRIANAGGPTIWYTDAFGKRAATAPFPGSIRQIIAPVNAELGVDFDGPSMGAGRHYGGSGVRSPN